MIHDIQKIYNSKEFQPIRVLADTGFHKSRLFEVSLSSFPHNHDFQRPWKKKPFENIVGKGENAGLDQHFILFPQCFHPSQNKFWESVKPHYIVQYGVSLSVEWLCLRDIAWLTYWTMLNPLPNDKFLDSLKLQDFSDDNFKINKGCGELSKRVENHVGKGETCRYEQFFLFPQRFRKCTADK